MDTRIAVLLTVGCVGCGTLSMPLDQSADLTNTQVEQINGLRSDWDLNLVVGREQAHQGDFKLLPVLPIFFSGKAVGRGRSGYLAARILFTPLFYSAAGVSYDYEGRRKERVSFFGLWPLFGRGSRTDLRRDQSLATFTSFLNLPIMGSFMGVGSNGDSGMYSIFFIRVGDGWSGEPGLDVNISASKTLGKP